jgi:hypothetical protein
MACSSLSSAGKLHFPCLAKTGKQRRTKNPAAQGRQQVLAGAALLELAGQHRSRIKSDAGTVKTSVKMGRGRSQSTLEAIKRQLNNWSAVFRNRTTALR